jgi:hypothetical protein
MLTELMPPEFENVFLTFSARTSANQTQDIIDGKMDKRRKGVYGPPTGKKYVIFVDDLNMPQREKYFAQPPIEILRQWMDHDGWYERRPPCSFRKIIDSQVCLAAAHVSPALSFHATFARVSLLHFFSVENRLARCSCTPQPHLAVGNCEVGLQSECDANTEHLQPLVATA